MQVCTIIAKNYVAHARVLARSLAEHNPDSRLWTLVIDDYAGYIDPADEPFEVLSPADIECEPFTYMALRYTVLELSTAVKPWLLRYLLGKTGGPVTYLDPDIKVYGSLARLDELAGQHGVALIPHNNTPLPPDGRKPSQIDVMIAGVYNLGYVSVAPRPEVEDLLDWWADRLRRDCRVDPVWGYFVDQRWFDLVPGFLEDFAIVRDPEFNVAYWNLHSRRLERNGDHYLVDGRPVAFFHFSGFDPERPLSLSLHQNRIDVVAHPALERLLAEYAADVMGEGHAVSRNWPYSYRALGDGTEIDDFVRSLCEEFDDDLEQRGTSAPSPFTLAGARTFQSWLGEDAPGAPPGINRILARVYEDRADLREAFPNPGGADRQPLLTWAREIGSYEAPLLGKAIAATNGTGHLDASSELEPRLLPELAHRPLKPLPEGPFGVNVAGYFHSDGQLGEAARQFVCSFDAGGIASAPVQDWTSPQRDTGQPYSTLPPEDAPYPVNLICADPSALGEFARNAGERFFAGRYSIGLWLAEVPPSTDELTLFQEIWAPSSYVATSLAPLATIPVNVVPIPVQPPASDVRRRQELGLPDEEFLFVCNVDPGGSIARQNPLGIIDAFRRAFEVGEPAHLVVNCLGPGRGWDGFEELESAAAERPEVRVTTGLTRPASIGLTALCDSYVSLHKAEAFGLSIAEAMWLGRPVIVTGYSGNLDYTTASNSFLVNYELAPVPSFAGGSFFGGEWADPDIEHAAALMREVFDDRAAARAVGARASTDIRRRHSPAVVAKAVGRRLESIRATGHGPRGLDRPRQRPAALAHVQARVRQGPPPVPRGGAAHRVRAALRRAILRTLRPYTDYQGKVNAALIGAIEGLHDSATNERAQLLAELRGIRQLRSAIESQAGAVDELRRVITLQSDRAQYLALAELGDRHAEIKASASPPPNSLGLANFELRAYSQNGEDGVLAEILRRIGVENRVFVEFGVESGVEGNCVYLADIVGWRGLFMESDDQMYRLLERKYGPRAGIRTIQAYVSPENVVQLLDQAEVPGEPDVISIDVDGQDYWIWEAIDERRPRVVVIEYNSTLDPHRRLVQPKDVAGWDGTDYFGASLGAIRSLGEHKGYQLVHTELAGSNAFLVRADLAEGRFLSPDEVATRGIPNYFQTGYRHPEDPAGRQYLDLDKGELVSSPNQAAP